MSPPTPSRSTGRPREFKPDEALARALEVFWNQGYEGASNEPVNKATSLATLTRLTWLATSTPLPRAWRYKPPAAPVANNSTASSTSPYAPGQPDTDRPRATRCLKGSMSQGPEAVDSHGCPDC